jgi:hypothetical protein
MTRPFSGRFAFLAATTAVSLAAALVPASAQAGGTPLPHGSPSPVPAPKLHRILDPPKVSARGVALPHDANGNPVTKLPRGAKVLPSGLVLVPVAPSKLVHRPWKSPLQDPRPTVDYSRHPNTTTSESVVYECLYNSNDFCQGAKKTRAVGDLVIQDATQVVIQLIVLAIWYILNRGGPKDPSLSFQIYTWYPKTPSGWPAHRAYQCMGVWGYDNHPHLGSCNSKHGIYWILYQAYKGNNYAFWMWDTYSHCWEQGAKNLRKTGTVEWCGVGNDWHTWADYLPKK